MQHSELLLCIKSKSNPNIWLQRQQHPSFISLSLSGRSNCLTADCKLAEKWWFLRDNMWKQRGQEPPVVTLKTTLRYPLLYDKWRARQCVSGSRKLIREIWGAADTQLLSPDTKHTRDTSQNSLWGFFNQIKGGGDFYWMQFWCVCFSVSFYKSPDFWHKRCHCGLVNTWAGGALWQFLLSNILHRVPSYMYTCIRRVIQSPAHCQWINCSRACTCQILGQRDLWLPSPAGHKRTK